VRLTWRETNMRFCLHCPLTNRPLSSVANTHRLEEYRHVLCLPSSTLSVRIRIRESCVKCSAQSILPTSEA
jgi:hypothetical protein